MKGVFYYIFLFCGIAIFKSFDLILNSGETNASGAGWIVIVICSVIMWINWTVHSKVAGNKPKMGEKEKMIENLRHAYADKKI